jgi:hypothetical protein
MKKTISLCPLFYCCDESHRREQFNNEQFQGYCLGLAMVREKIAWNYCSQFVKEIRGVFQPCTLFEECMKKYSLAKKCPKIYRRMCGGINSKNIPTGVTYEGNLCPEMTKKLLPIRKLLKME